MDQKVRRRKFGSKWPGAGGTFDVPTETDLEDADNDKTNQEDSFVFIDPEPRLTTLVRVIFRIGCPMGLVIGHTAYSLQVGEWSEAISTPMAMIT